MLQISVLQFICYALLFASTLLVGCNRNENNGRATGVNGTDPEITGSGRISTGDGGFGSGPTGTGGQEPAENEEEAVGNADVGKEDEE